MVHLPISVVLGSLCVTLCSGGLSEILNGKGWLKGVELVAKPILLDEKMPMMEMKGMDSGKSTEHLKLLAIKTLISESTSKDGNDGGDDAGKGWKVEDVKAWEMPKMQNGGGKEEQMSAEQPKPPPKWVLVKVSSAPMEPPAMESPPKMMVMMQPETKGWEMPAEPPKMMNKPEMMPPKMMMMMKPESKGWEVQPEVEKWKALDIKAWESQTESPKEATPMESPKMMMMKPESKGWQPLPEAPNTTMMAKGWEPQQEWKTVEIKGWEEPQMMMMMKQEPPKMTTASKGWEPPKMMKMKPEPPAEMPKKWVLVQVKESKPEMEPPKSNEMKDPWKAAEDAVALWEKSSMGSGGAGSTWKTTESRNRPFVFGFDAGLKAALQERGRIQKEMDQEKRIMESRSYPDIYKYTKDNRPFSRGQATPIL